MRLKQCIILLALPSLAPMAQALPMTYSPGALNFSASGQNMWGSGSGVAPVSKSYATSWNSSSKIGGITGNENEVIVAAIPATPAVTRDIWIPETWDDHGSWKKHYKWGVPYWDWHSDWRKHGGYNKTITVIPASPGIPAQTLDTRTGTEIQFSSSGSVGVTSSLGFNGGTIDADVSYDASLALPDQLQVGEYFNLAPSSTLSSASLESQFPSLTGSVSASLSARIDMLDKTCFAGLGCSTKNTSLLNIAPTDLDILKVNTDDLPNDKMSVFGLDEMAFDVTRGKVYTDMVIEPGGVVHPVVSLPFMTPPLAVGMTVGDVELDYPDFGISGSLQNGKIVAAGSVEDIVAINADIDAVASMQTGAPIQGGVVYAQPLTFRGDMLDIDLGPTMDLSQSLELDPTLMVDLSFDHAVKTQAGDEIDFWSGIFADMPDFALLDEHAVTVTPTYWLDAMLSNQTTLDFDLTLSMDILKGSINALGIDLASYMLDDMSYAVGMGSADVFNTAFNFGGFGRTTGASFVLGANRSPIVVSSAGSTQVPEPASILLFAIGLAGMGWRLKQRTIQDVI